MSTQPLVPDTRRAHGARCDGDRRCWSCRAADRAGEQRKRPASR